MSVMEERAKIRVIRQVHLRVDEVRADECRKSHLSRGLSPCRKIMEPGAHDRARDIALRRRKINAKHTTVFDTVRDVLKEMFASTIGRKTRKTIIEGFDHLGGEGDSLKMTKKVDLVKMGKMNRNGMVPSPTVLGANGEPRSNGTR